jgi:hypothetical protein
MTLPMKDDEASSIMSLRHGLLLAATGMVIGVSVAAAVTSSMPSKVD